MEAAATCWDWRPEAPSRLEQGVSLLRLAGPDALRVLHGQTSQAIEGAAPGSALATCVISPTARLRAIAQVLVDGDGAWLLIEAGDGAAVRTALDRVLFPADRVELGPLLQARLITPLRGASEAALPASWPHCTGGQWQPLEGASGVWLLGEQLVLLDAEAAPQEPLHLALAEALASRIRLNHAEQERWRLQQGIPAPPGELNDEVNPFELGLADRVSLNKGCYVGQETLAKLATYGGVKQQLRRWCWLQPKPAASTAAKLAPAAGQALSGATGERAGVISSALPIAQDDGSVLWLGLCLVRRSALNQPTLRLGDQGPELAVSVPAAFVEPPQRS
jgi:folate-binding protein YgfZ